VSKAKQCSLLRSYAEPLNIQNNIADSGVSTQTQTTQSQNLPKLSNINQTPRGAGDGGRQSVAVGVVDVVEPSEPAAASSDGVVISHGVAVPLADLILAVQDPPGADGRRQTMFASHLSPVEWHEILFDIEWFDVQVRRREREKLMLTQNQDELE